MEENSPSVSVGRQVFNCLVDCMDILLRYRRLSGSKSEPQGIILYPLILLFSSWLLTLDANAQWQVVAGQDTLSWTWANPSDDLLTSEQQLIGKMHQDGYLYATIDSANTSSKVFFVSKGPRATIESIMIEGINAMDSSMISLPVKRGDWMTSTSMKQMAESILDHYSEIGYVLAEVTIGAILPRDSIRHDVWIQVMEGEHVHLEEVILLGAKRTKSAFVVHTSGLNPGQKLSHFQPTEIQRKLQATGIFRRVDRPVVYQTSDSSVVIHVSVKESPLGAFDLALGYERSDGGHGALIGSGNLVLRNLFGGARTFELKLNRAPDQLGYVMVHVETPLLFGLPISIMGGFEGLQQDSTYGQREYQAQIGYWIDPSVKIFASITREITRPGLTGTQFLDGLQRIPVANALFVGGGIEIRKLNHAISPTEGYRFMMHAESGHTDKDRLTEAPDSMQQQRRLRQGRLTTEGRVYLPVTSRSLFVTGGELMLLRSQETDESDLFRIGGAQSLRGYDEHRFRASFAIRMLMEYRYLLDQVTYGFGFLDLGYLHNPKESRFLSGWYPGFGVGFQLNTPAGMVHITLASTTEDLTAIRAHIGFSLEM